METLSFADFKKIDLKVAEIKKASEHPDADKLLILEIDTGSKTKQIVAGIRGYYTADELVGRQIAVVDNLEPTTIRGVRSEGMLLAVQDKGRTVLLGIDKPVTNGSSIL